MPRPKLSAMAPLDILHKSPLFSGLDRNTLKAMAGAFTLGHWRGNSELMAPEDTAEQFMVLVQGRAKVSCSNGQDGRELTLWLLGPGDGVDVLSLLDGKAHAVSVRTLEEVEALSVPLALVRQWIERYPAFRLAAHHYIARQLREVAELAGDLALHNTMSRLAELLLRHFDSSRSSQPNLIHDLPHEELAHLIGSVRVVVNRLISGLKREGIVELRDGALRVMNLKRLLGKVEAQMGTGSTRSGGSQATGG